MAFEVVPLVPSVAEVDPETPIPFVPFRLAALVPSLLGLPLRLVCGPAVVLLAESLLAVALDRIHPLALVAE